MCCLRLIILSLFYLPVISSTFGSSLSISSVISIASGNFVESNLSITTKRESLLYTLYSTQVSKHEATYCFP